MTDIPTTHRGVAETNWTPRRVLVCGACDTVSVLLAESKYNLRPRKALERDGDGVDSEERSGRRWYNVITLYMCSRSERRSVATQTIHIPNESTRRESYTTALIGVVSGEVGEMVEKLWQ